MIAFGSILWNLLKNVGVWILEKLGHLPKGLVEKILIYTLFVVVGWIACYNWYGLKSLAAERAELKVYRAAAEENQKKRDRLLSDIPSGMRLVDDKAWSALNDRVKQSEARALSAQAQLERERKTRLENDIDVSHCRFSGATRVMLDEVAGSTPGRPDSAMESAGMAAGGSSPAAEAPDLTMDQLADGYLNLGRHDQACVARNVAWRTWYQGFLDWWEKNVGPPPS